MKPLIAAAACAALLYGARGDIVERLSKTENQIPGDSVAPADAVEAQISLAAYNELVAENRRLRKELQDVGVREAAARQTSQALQQEVRSLETRLADLAVRLAAPATDVRHLPASDAGTIAELNAQIESLQQKVATLRDSELKAKLRIAELTAVREPAAPSPLAVLPPKSDLIEALEREKQNMLTEKSALEAQFKDASIELLTLRETVMLRENEIAKAAGELQQSQQLTQQVIERNRQFRGYIERLMTEVARLEQDKTGKEGALRDSETALREARAKIAALQSQLTRRERSEFVVAPSAQSLLADAAARADSLSAAQLRDMHYNLANVHATEGRYAQAEAEYLRALNIDPRDPYVHFNLGVLYGDRLAKPARAAVHLRRYLELKPDAPDAAEVAKWIVEFEAVKP